MNGLTITAQDIYEKIQHLPQDSLIDLDSFVEFLRYKADTGARAEEDGSTATPPAPAEFVQAVAAFERLKPQLLDKYRGRVVAIYQDQVVAVGDDRLAVFDEVVSKLGHVHCYIEWVVPEAPRRVRMPSTFFSQPLRRGAEPCPSYAPCCRSPTRRAWLSLPGAWTRPG